MFRGDVTLLSLIKAPKKKKAVATYKEVKETALDTENCIDKSVALKLMMRMIFLY